MATLWEGRLIKLMLLPQLLVSLLFGWCGKTGLATIFEACQTHLFQEALAGVQTGIGGRGSQATSIDVALPVGSDNDAALTIHIATSQTNRCALVCRRYGAKVIKRIGITKFSYVFLFVVLFFLLTFAT